MTPTEQIEKYEQELVKAMLKSDVQQLDALISENLIFTDHTGLVLDKTTDLEAHRSGTLRISSLKTSEQLVKVYKDTAVVSVLMTIEGCYAGQPLNVKLRFTRVWVNCQGKWKVVAGHSVVVNN